MYLTTFQQQCYFLSGFCFQVDQPNCLVKDVSMVAVLSLGSVYVNPAGPVPSVMIPSVDQGAMTTMVTAG